MQLDFPMPIITPRLIMRQPLIKDAHEYYQAVTDSMNELRLWLPWAKYSLILPQIERYIRECHINWITKDNNDIGLALLITEKQSGKLLGNVVLWNIDWNIPKFELGFWLRTSETKNGYITEAVNALSHYCFLQLNAKRIEVRCEINNTQALQIPKRLGFDLDGILRNSTIAISDDKLTDAVLFSCIDINNLPELNVEWGTTIRTKQLV